MPKTPDTPGTDMAKTQKTFFLNEDLCRFVEAYVDRTGTSFTKIVTAALIRYLFNEGQLPHERWIRIATALDKGSIAAADIPLGLVTADLEEVTRDIDGARQAGAEDGEYYLENLRSKQGLFKRAKDHWEDLMRQGKDPVEAIEDYLRGPGFSGVVFKSTGYPELNRDTTKRKKK